VEWRKASSKTAGVSSGHNAASTDRDPVKLIGNYWPYATTIFDYTRRATPWQQPKTLTDDDECGDTTQGEDAKP
jgi:cytochrome c